MKRKPKDDNYYCEPYPYNLMTALFGKPIEIPVTEDQMNGIEYALDRLMEREKDILSLRFKDEQTFAAIAEKYGITSGRIQQITDRALRKLRAPALSNAILYGLEIARKQSKVREKESELNQRWGALRRKQEQLEKEEAKYKDLAEKFNADKKLFAESVCGKCIEADSDVLYSQVKIEELGLSVRAYNCVKRAGKNYVSQLMKMTVYDLMKVRNLGRRAMDEIITKVLEFTGYDIRKNDEQ